MIGADGAGADELHRRAFQERAVDVGHRAHQQHIGLLDRGAVDGTAGHAAYLAKPFEEGVEQRNIFVGNNQHGRLLSRTRSVQACGLCSSADPLGERAYVGAGLPAMAVGQSPHY